MLRPTCNAFTAFAVILALATPAPAADEDLTDKQKADIEKACLAAADVCRNSCGAKFPNRDTSFNDGLLFDFCTGECNSTESKCVASVRISGGAAPRGGLVLDPGTGNPPPTTKSFQKPNNIFSK